MRTPWMTLGFLSALLGLGALTLGCGGNNTEGQSPDTQADAEGGAGGSSGATSDAGTDASAGAAGSAGEGGAAGATVLPDRGDPDTFPAECLESCDEACSRLASCGGADSTGFPLDEQSCLERCAVRNYGQSGPSAVRFKCCVSQDACEDVKECGGWLAHPGTVEACDRYCECRMTNAVIELTSGHQAPNGYRFAPDLLMLEPLASVSSPALPAGVRLVREGKRRLVRLDSNGNAATLEALRVGARVLPTFVDAAGRVSAASGDLVVLVDDAASLQAVSTLAAKYGLDQPRSLGTHLRERPDARLAVLKGTDPWRTLDAAVALSSMPGVHAEPDQWRRYVKHHTPNDPSFADQWHLQNTGQESATVSVDGRVNEAWDVTLGDPQVIIAINDDGVDLNHPEFAGRLMPELSYPQDWLTQMQGGNFGGHGTSVAGVAAAAADNAQGGAGVCPGCSLLGHLLGETSGQGFQLTDASVAQGFKDIVDAGAWVINNSWGLDLGDPVYADNVGVVPPLAIVVKSAFDYAETSGRGGLGTVILFATGNSNAGLDPYTAHAPILAVSAVDDLGLKPYYSSFGPNVDIAAPSSGGVNGITTTAPNSKYTSEFGGTSSACPFVAGVVGLILSADPTLTAQQARDTLTSTATKIDPVFGQWNDDGHSNFHGAGLVNAYAAVQLAAGGCASPETCTAPSDDCGADCGTGTQCDLCRTHADCAEGHVCQALPSLGALVCIAAKGSDGCPAGTREVNGYCIPSPATCGFCGNSEVCNGRDDDCNGEVDDGNVCQGGAWCFIDGTGCGTGMVCAGHSCTAGCAADSDCSNATCEQLTNQYGVATGEKACMRSYGGSFNCASRCETRASGLNDEGLTAFTSCVQDNTQDCDTVIDCRDLLTPPPTN